LQGNIYAYIAGNPCTLKKWNGTNWTNIAGGPIDGSTATYFQERPMCTDAQGNLYLAGSFVDTQGKRYVAKWDGTAWSTVGTLNINGDVWSMTCDSTGALYIGGKFYYQSGNAVEPYYVAKFDGTNWLPLGGHEGLYADGLIKTILVDGGGVYAAGEFKDKLGNYCVVSKYGCNSNLSPQIVVSVSSYNVEVGASITYAAAISNMNNTNGYTLQWLKNGVPIPGMNASTFVSNSIVSSDVITCQLTTSANCSSAITVSSNAISVTVNQIAGS
jgi:hypothetical protein